jgi:hypothetical protein
MRPSGIIYIQSLAPPARTNVPIIHLAVSVSPAHPDKHLAGPQALLDNPRSCFPSKPTPLARLAADPHTQRAGDALESLRRLCLQCVIAHEPRQHLVRGDEAEQCHCGLRKVRGVYNNRGPSADSNAGRADQRQTFCEGESFADVKSEGGRAERVDQGGLLCGRGAGGKGSECRSDVGLAVRFEDNSVRYKGAKMGL